MSNAFEVIDFTAPGASKIRERLENKQAELYRELGSMSCGPDRTQQIRGALNLIEELLHAGQAPQVLKMPRYGSADAFRRAQERAQGRV